MKRRLVVALAGLAISFALPTYAQQKDLADPQTTQKILASFKGYDEAITTTMPPLVPRFTRATRFLLRQGGQSPVGKPLRNGLADLYQWWHPKNSITKVDGNAFHLIGTAGNEAWATGEWSETGQGKHGGPFAIKGYWLSIYVREADDWKIRVSAWNTAPDSVHTRRPQFCTTTGGNAIPEPPALAVNKLATKFFDDKSLKSIGRPFFLPPATRMLLDALRNPVAVLRPQTHRNPR